MLHDVLPSLHHGCLLHGYCTEQECRHLLVHLPGGGYHGIQQRHCMPQEIRHGGLGCRLLLLPAMVLDVLLLPSTAVVAIQEGHARAEREAFGRDLSYQSLDYWVSSLSCGWC